MLKNLLSFLSAVVLFVGFFMLLGTMGALEQNLITLHDGIIRSVIVGILMLIAGAYVVTELREDDYVC